MKDLRRFTLGNAGFHSPFAGDILKPSSPGELPAGMGEKRVAAEKRLPGAAEITLEQEESVLEWEKMVLKQVKVIL